MNQGDVPDTGDHTRRNRSTYDRIAGLYGERQRRWRSSGGRTFAAVEDAFVAALPRNALVADVGCGPALDAARLARRGLRAVGVDLSAGMLAVAADVLAGRLAQADLRALPVAGGALDGVWCSAALLHVPEEQTPVVLGEFRRILRAGGVLALTTALGEGSVSEPVPYAEGEVRWFVYRDANRLLLQLASAGFRARTAAEIPGNRRWFAVLADVGG